MRLRRLLVANRGEIALRVFRTCRRLGIETIAVAPDDDAGSLHARSADAVVRISSYLDGAEHLRAAREAGADAVHPGYGFLAESAVFAGDVEAAGLVWVGPSAECLRLGGDKLAAKRIAAAAGVPTLEHGSASEVAPPLLVKAAAGGGGRGMRIVREPARLEEAVAAAAREAELAFGDGTVFCERYLERPRHVEVQVVADAGGVVALGIRDCSVQRRHQKLVEESPPPGLGAGLCERLVAAAVAFAAAIDYRSAGTVEFLVDGDDLFFLELNGRIQVEHPVTEALTGLDLVELQLRVASDDRLGLEPQGWLERPGHAIETRLYAEDPHTFLPQAGRIERLRLPAGLRVDAAVAEGDVVGTGYDPLLAKVIASGSTRAEALARLGSALGATEVRGVTTNLPFLRWLLAHPRYREGDLSTAFLTECPPLSHVPARLPAGPFRGPWRLNLPPPAPAPAPDADAAAPVAPASGAGGGVVAPMPGTVIRVEVHLDDEVVARQPLVVLEAMKMETPVVAPFAGRVTALHVGPGDQVAAGAALIDLGR